MDVVANPEELSLVDIVTVVGSSTGPLTVTDVGNASANSVAIDLSGEIPENGQTVTVTIQPE